MSKDIRVTITFPTQKQIALTVSQFGKTLSRGSLTECNSTLERKDIAPLEIYLVENKIPFDLVEYADMLNTPKVRRYRPLENYSKEIACLPCGDEENDGLIVVSELLNILETSTIDNLRDNLMAQIRKSSFYMDNVTEL